MKIRYQNNIKQKLTEGLCYIQLYAGKKTLLRFTVVSNDFIP